LNKLNGMTIRDAVRTDAPHNEADLLIIGMGSTGGTIDEARSRLNAEGLRTNHITIRQIHPFPTSIVQAELEKAKKVVVLENNATGQLASQVKLYAGSADKIESVLKYDGNPFLPSEVYKACKELI